MDNNFANWKFKIHGLVENPLELSLTDLHAMKKQMQITEHSCIHFSGFLESEFNRFQ
jgi:DMSO/TMAO reductase YedYZ molybdopterin-dependent catalytic subunit